jgi:hypothetical protein
MVRNLTKAQYEVLFNDPKILSKEDKAYWKVINPYRKVCGFANLPIKSTYPLNFSGVWMFVEEQSKPGPAGVGNVPYLMRIYPDNERMLVKKNFIVEWGDDRSSEEEIYLDGSDMKSDENSATRITTVSWTKEPPAMVINSKRTFTRGENTRETNSSETWTISEEGKQLIIHRKTEGFRGEKSEDELVYKRQ